MNRKRITRSASVLGFIIPIVILGFQFSPAGPPIAAFDSIQQRVEALRTEDHVGATYKLRNAGGSPLLVSIDRTSCGCSEASAVPPRLAPGEAGEIRVVGEPPPAGEKAVTITVSTNDPLRPEVELGLVMVGTRVTIPYIANHNGPIRYGELSQVPAASLLTITTREHAGQPPWIAVASSTKEGVEIEGGLIDERPYGDDAILLRRYDYRVKLKDLPQPGEFHFQVELASESGPEPICTIEASGSVPRPVTPSPAAIYSAAINQQDRPDFHLDFVADASLPNLDVSAPTIEGLTITRLEQDRRTCRFRIDVDRDASLPLMGKIIFRTNHPSAPTVEIPYMLAAPVRLPE